MRCVNCGWDNRSNTTVCVKCGQPLRSVEGYADSQNNFVQGERYGEAIPKPTVLNANPDEEKCRKTVVFSAVNDAENRPTVTQLTTECPNCGYPVAGEFASCPNCGIRMHRPTIRRQIKNIADTEPDALPRCSLTIIPEEDEKISPERFDYEGKSVILNRENTEVANRTITSKEQAEIVFEDGHWYIVDRSELKTTYIQANRKIEIMPDDIIVLGDRRFKFESD